MNERKEVLEFELWDEFVDAIHQLDANEKYFELVAHHMDMSHNMHTMGIIDIAPSGELSVPIGTQRFLPWHRQYLLEFEKSLQSINPNLTLPYWNWSTNRKFPEQLTDLVLDLRFRMRDENGGVKIVKTSSHRRNNPFEHSYLPDEAAVQGAMNETNYIKFSVEIEGRGIIDDFTGEYIPYENGSAGLHNLVHGIVGGIMGNTMFSPSDPIFWLHHCYCDKLWWDWQQLNPDASSTLTGLNKIMDPWNVSDDELSDIANLSYKYV